MSITTLHFLAEQELPVTVSGGENVDAIYILAVAGHVEATISEAVRTIDGWVHPCARVTAITPLGRRMLRKFPARPDEGCGAGEG